jgi:poly-gamma-glutamate synthesis protein (capsule biosynthesis protein)
VVHGHSSHHPKGIEVYRNKPILYGCGDFINDYEGIGGYEEYRDDLTLMYFVTLDRTAGRLVRLEMIPMQMRRFRLRRTTPDDAQWLRDTLDRECARRGVKVRLADGQRLSLDWQ